LIKVLKRMNGARKEKYKVPKSVQDLLPIDVLYKDGTVKLKNRFSRTYKFNDINYRVASKDDQMAMFMSYCELLNTLDTGATTKITINNRRLNKADFENSILIKKKDDGLDYLRDEYNEMLTSKAMGAGNNIVQEKYITVSSDKKNIAEARKYFARIGTDLTSYLSKLASKPKALDVKERLRILHDFYRIGNEVNYRFDIAETMKKGHSFKDYICPDSMDLEADHIKIGDKFARVIYLREYASYIKDSMITELSDLPKNMMLSIDIVPVPTDEAIKEMNKRIMGVETDITRYQQKQNRNNNFSAVIPYDLEQMRQETKEFMSDLTTRDQRMIFATVTIIHVADSLEELNEDTESLISTGRKHLCEFSTLKYQQIDGLHTVLPLGSHKLPYKWRTLTTESTAVLMPFATQEIQEIGGTYYGENAISKNMIIADRRNLLNGNGFILGVSGSGKSFTAKGEIVDIALSSDSDIIIVDPEAEFSPLVNAIGGEVIKISAASDNNINAMDISENYGGEENPIILKSEFILSLCEQLVGSGRLSAKEKSLIDRCTANVYRDHVNGGFKGDPPTLQDFHAELMKQNEPEAQDIALAIELFTKGSLNTFAKQTNVDVNSRIVCYDIKDLGKQLKTIGMLVVLDSIFNRITKNRELKRNTYIWIDEIYILFANEYSANFLFELWKRVRKYGAMCSGITQNISDLLVSHTACTMLSNSEFLVMLNQSASDRNELAKLLNISDTQLSYITNAEAGKGLLKVGGSLVPFENNFPKDTKLYSLMTTKISEIPDNLLCNVSSNKHGG
jgi:type IV secretory pathway VirB4 component